MSSGRTATSESISGVVNSLIERLGSQKSVYDSPQPKSTHSSASSWSEEPAPNNMDISTGHMILSYLEDHLMNKTRLEEEWKALQKYQDHWTFNSATLVENQPKNRSDILPYDHSRVVLSSVLNPSKSDYINANSIYDHDPRNPTYIATQGPMKGTVNDFWQMVWEQGSVVLANLTRLQENNEEKCYRYWPENGSETYNIFQNLNTSETRTVTQFHFLTWSDGGVPLSAKSVLEFRRKINKSYRGQACPIVIHCSDGAGRTGTYVLLDMVLNRINKGQFFLGVKEVNIAATLEHLRDQRKGLVQTIEQFQFVLTCIALEVQEILKTMPEQ
ncbi:unnamed protein product [Soboliphyme baturini]|uniref:Protein-tyrosine-phosphatase n=1 Tax=Soboliphyme baturini TaxID=241478 RepID=A0A183IE69_9BILA|nr:unnamed protein product [Soboliphyme baturini]